MGGHGSAPLLGADRDRRWLVRGAAAGAGAMLGGVIVAVGFVAAVVGNAGPGWDNRLALTGVLFTVLWCAAAAGAGAVGAWQAAEGGAPHPAAARLAGAIGPVVLIVLASVSALGGDGASSGAVVVEAVVEVAAAILGAGALARRLETGW
jgi:hypothetical protein